jgi:hypothetical protein
MHAANLGDFRPLDGPLNLAQGRTPAVTVRRVEALLDIATSDVARINTTPLTHPGDVPTYQIYPGGKIYYAEPLDATLANVQLTPDMRTNPLGVYWRNGAVTLRDNVSIQGTIITSGSSIGPDLIVDGANIHLAAVDLPSIEGEEQPVQLPAAIVQDDFIVTGDARDSTLRGMVLTWDDFRFPIATDRTEFRVEGRLIVDELRLKARCEWAHDWDWWHVRMQEFLGQADDAQGTPYLPLWLYQRHGMDPEPKLTIQPAASPVRYHWHDWSQPLFRPHASDEGLIWDLVEWRDTRRSTDASSPGIDGDGNSGVAVDIVPIPTN